MKPILFNEQMMRAILDGKKTQTRRAIRHYRGNAVYKAACHYGKWFPGFSADRPPDFLIDWYVKNNARPPYAVSDILYCRETWSRYEDGEYAFRTDYGTTEDDSFPPSMLKWHPSIHMPRDAARVFLRVKNIYAERLQSISDKDIIAEGIDSVLQGHTPIHSYRGEYMELWDSTVSEKDLIRYGWIANPWVWVIHFERISKEEALQCSLQNAECAADKSAL